MEFRILGPLEIVDGTRTISIRTGNDRAVLAMLLLRGNEAVSTEWLIEELWGSSPPPTAAKILQSSVSRLRRELEPARIETRGHGYLLHVGAEELDAARFERLLGERREREALELWRGPPLADIADHPSTADAARRLTELRVDALEARIDEDIAAGRGGAVIRELEALTREHPFRERLHGQLMRALYSEGRQKEALEAYRTVRRSLDAELGLEPGPELQELERAILRQDPSLPRAPRRQQRSRRGGALLAGVAAAALAATAAVLLTRSRPAPTVVAPNSVVAIDPGGNRIVASTPLGVGAQPGEIAVASSGVWVTNAPADSVVRIDPATRRITHSYDVGGAAADIAGDRGGTWVVTGNDDALFRIQADGTMRRTALPPSFAGAFAVATGGGAVWVAGDRLLKIDETTGKLVGASGACCAPIDVAFADGAVWIAERNEQVAKLGARSLAVISEQNLGELDLRLAASRHSVWAAGTGTFASREPSVVWRLDAVGGPPKITLPLGRPARSRLWTTAIAVGGGAVWVAIADNRAVYRLDPRTGSIVARIPTTRPPYAVAFGAGRLWVSVH